MIIVFAGDFSTKMEFRYDGYSSTFSLVSIQNEIDLEADCFRCTRFSALSWTQLQVQSLCVLCFVW